MTPFTGTVLVAGATGRTGREIVKRLFLQGTNCRLFVRSEEQALQLLGTPAAGILRIGSVLHRDECLEAMKGIDAVICAIGSNPADPTSPPPSAIDRDGVARLAETASRSGVSRFILISSLGATRKDHPLNKYGQVLTMKFEGEEAVRKYFSAENKSYTIIRPGGLVDTPSAIEKLIIAEGDTISGSISRIDVALLATQSLYKQEYNNKTFETVTERGQH